MERRDWIVKFMSTDGISLEHVSEFKYLGCVLDEWKRKDRKEIMVK